MAFRPARATDAPPPEVTPVEPYRPAPFWRFVMLLPMLLFLVCLFILTAVILGAHFHNQRMENSAVGYALGYIACGARRTFSDLVYKR